MILNAMIQILIAFISPDLIIVLNPGSDQTWNSIRQILIVDSPPNLIFASNPGLDPVILVHFRYRFLTFVDNLLTFHHLSDVLRHILIALHHHRFVKIELREDDKSYLMISLSDLNTVVCSASLATVVEGNLRDGRECRTL
ncbi:hypothetical protein QR98_0087020 [Sarcoptes scabiei]|uniref:Uncharacterized protein n=1 Tax=Sarcoptes scabiei TaxID=52283 RepID=A0A132AGN7_SARSC|nr:hypothetical protein QR98_0087020 [Sarcoptes scabiei]